MRSTKLLWLAVFILPLLVLSACGGGEEAKTEANTHQMPDHIQQAPPRVREAYEFAVSHPEDLVHQPCYCGCGNMGHTSNLSCYVQEIKPDGEIVYDNHALGCGVCVDITHDVIRLKDQGKTPLQIRQYVDAVYAAFGPSTDTAMPVE